MDKAFTTVEIGSKICHVCQYDSRADGSVCHKRPIFYWGIDSRNKKRIMTTISYLESRLKEKPLDAGFLIVAYESEKWNDDFSPWKAQAAFGNDGFGGNADRTLEWLVNQCIPYIEAEDSVYIKNDTKVQRYTVGYSLAGLLVCGHMRSAGFLQEQPAVPGLCGMRDGLHMQRNTRRLFAGTRRTAFT